MDSSANTQGSKRSDYGESKFYVNECGILPLFLLLTTRSMRAIAVYRQRAETGQFQRTRQFDGSLTVRHNSDLGN